MAGGAALVGDPLVEARGRPEGSPTAGRTGTRGSLRDEGAAGGGCSWATEDGNSAGTDVAGCTCVSLAVEEAGGTQPQAGAVIYANPSRPKAPQWPDGGAEGDEVRREAAAAKTGGGQVPQACAASKTRAAVGGGGRTGRKKGRSRGRRGTFPARATPVAGERFEQGWGWTVQRGEGRSGVEHYDADRQNAWVFGTGARRPGARIAIRYQAGTLPVRVQGSRGGWTAGAHFVISWGLVAPAQDSATECASIRPRPFTAPAAGSRTINRRRGGPGGHHSPNSFPRRISFQHATRSGTPPKHIAPPAGSRSSEGAARWPAPLPSANSRETSTAFARPQHSTSSSRHHLRAPSPPPTAATSPRHGDPYAAPSSCEGVAALPERNSITSAAPARGRAR